MQITVCDWTAEDIPAVAEIEKSCLKRSWTQKMLEEEFNSPFFACIVAKTGGEVAAYLSYHIIVSEYHIANLAVKENFRRKGVARRLIGELVSRAKNNGVSGITLEVSANNLAALSLYQNCGFLKSGLRKNYYGASDDAVIMWKYL